MQPFSTISTAPSWVERYLSSASRLPVIQGAAASNSSRVQQSPIPLPRFPWPWVWAFTRPGWSKRWAADISVAPSGRAAGRPDLPDRVALDQDVARLGDPGSDVEHEPAAHNRMAHGNVSAEASRIIDRSA